MSYINSAYFIYILPKIRGAKAPSAPPVPTPMHLAHINFNHPYKLAKYRSVKFFIRPIPLSLDRPALTEVKFNLLNYSFKQV